MATGLAAHGIKSLRDEVRFLRTFKGNGKLLANKGAHFNERLSIAGALTVSSPGVIRYAQWPFTRIIFVEIANIATDNFHTYFVPMFSGFVTKMVLIPQATTTGAANVFISNMKDVVIAAGTSVEVTMGAQAAGVASEGDAAWTAYGEAEDVPMRLFRGVPRSLYTNVAGGSAGKVVAMLYVTEYHPG